MPKKDWCRGWAIGVVCSAGVILYSSDGNQVLTLVLCLAVLYLAYEVSQLYYTQSPSVLRRGMAKAVHVVRIEYEKDRWWFHDLQTDHRWALEAEDELQVLMPRPQPPGEDSCSG